MKAIRKIAEDIVKLITIVGAITVIHFFWYEANLESTVSFRFHTYDEFSITTDFVKYELKEPLKLYHSLGKSYARLIEFDSAFGPSNPLWPPSDTSALHNFNYFQNLKKALKFEFNPLVRDFIEKPNGAIINVHFWEEVYIDSLFSLMDSQIDSVIVFKAMKIILAHRQVTSALNIYNKGDLPAKNVKIHIRRPYLLWPRMLMTEAEVNILFASDSYGKRNIEKLNGSYELTSNHILPMQNETFHIVTSLQNISNYNIYIEFETDRKLNTNFVVYTFILLSILFYLPYVIGLISKKHNQSKSS